MYAVFFYKEEREETIERRKGEKIIVMQIHSPPQVAFVDHGALSRPTFQQANSDWLDVKEYHVT
jgi:hypothetical protein